MVFEVKDWLAQLPGDNLSDRYGQLLADAGFDSIWALEELSAEDCDQLGIKLGHRKVATVRISGMCLTPSCRYCSDLSPEVSHTLY